jgi:hypothetical protein
MRGVQARAILSFASSPMVVRNEVDEFTSFFWKLMEWSQDDRVDEWNNLQENEQE